MDFSRSRICLFIRLYSLSTRQSHAENKHDRMGDFSFLALSVIYLARGFVYNEQSKTFSPLSLLSGLAPPVGYSWIHSNHCPSNLNCFHSYEEGLAYAKQVNKPIMLDFTGWACVNCRKMEENVWNKPEVFKLINENYVLISLYVDDRETLKISNMNIPPNKVKRAKLKPWATNGQSFKPKPL